MPAPAAYTEDALKAFMLTEVGNLVTVLELTTTHFAEAVNDTLLAYGVATIDLATDIRKLRALAKVEAWGVAVAQAAGRYTFSTQNSRHERKAIHDQALAGLALARTNAASYATDYVIGLSGFTYAGDPYLAAEEADDNGLQFEDE